MEPELYGSYRLAQDSGMSDSEIGLLLLVSFVAGILLVALLAKTEL